MLVTTLLSVFVALLNAMGFGVSQEVQDAIVGVSIPLIALVALYAHSPRGHKVAALESPEAITEIVQAVEAVAAAVPKKKATSKAVKKV